MNAMPEPMVVDHAAYDSMGQRLPPIALDHISDVLRQPGTFVWVGLYEPNEALLCEMQRQFGLHELAVDDAHHAHQRPKLEVYGGSLFVVLHTSQEVDGRIAFGRTHAFLGRRYLLTVQHGASVTYAPIRSECERNPKMLALGPNYALYAVSSFVVDNFQPIIDAQAYTEQQ